MDLPAEQFLATNAALMVIGTNYNKDPKEVERHDNESHLLVFGSGQVAER